MARKIIFYQLKEESFMLYHCHCLPDIRLPDNPVLPGQFGQIIFFAVPAASPGKLQRPWYLNGNSENIARA